MASTDPVPPLASRVLDTSESSGLSETFISSWDPAWYIMRKLVKEKRKNKQKDVYKIVDIPGKNLSIYGKKYIGGISVQ